MSFIDDATFFRKSRLHQILGQLWLWLRPKVYQGYVVLLLVTTLGKCQIFVTFLLILQHLLMRYVWNYCDQAVVDMAWKALFCWDYQMDLSFAIHEAALLKFEAVQILFYLASISFQFCWIWCRKLTILCQFWAVFGCFWSNESQFSASIQQNWEVAEF